jgi:hypothetical protein
MNSFDGPSPMGLFLGKSVKGEGQNICLFNIKVTFFLCKKAEIAVKDQNDDES